MSSDNIFELRPAIETQPTETQPSRLVELAREQTEAAVNTIIAIMNSPTASNRDRLTAAEMILDYGWGKPTQTLVITGDDNDSHRPPAA
jgi:hypothetical protein